MNHICKYFNRAARMLRQSWKSVAGGSDRRLFCWANGKLLSCGRDEGLLGERIIELYEDRDGNVWVSTTEG